MVWGWTLDDLRELAHGVFPAVLGEGGLGPALWTLADRAAVAVELSDIPEERLPSAVEQAAYLIVSGAVDSATTTTRLDVHISRTPGRIASTSTARRRARTSPSPTASAPSVVVSPANPVAYEPTGGRPRSNAWLGPKISTT
jgi:hypothetical protein